MPKPNKPRGKPRPVETLPRISVASINQTEGAQGAMTFVVRIDRAVSRHIAFDFHTEDGAARAGFDYVGVAGTKIIPAGSVSTTIDVTILDDSEPEQLETFSLHVSPPRFV